jgi:hypothetical protein
MLGSLVLPIILTGVALFFASFLSWMVVQLHKGDWNKLARESEFMDAVRKLDVPRGNYSFPACDNPSEMNTPEFQEKMKAGPRGTMSIYAMPSMPRNLALTMVSFLVVTFCLAYLATIVPLPAGASFMTVFRFFATAAFLVYCTAIIQNAIWFPSRIVGHVIESIAYGVITGLIFGLMWPK